mgnify:CR=1 FL=1
MKKINIKGFTLTELIAVIAIIGVVLVIVVPATRKIMDNNASEKHILYVQTVEKAVIAYANIEGTVGIEKVSIQKLLDKQYLSTNGNVNNTNQEITYKKLTNGKITVNNIKLTFNDDSTCDKTNCY